MVRDQFGVKLLYPSSKTNTQYVAFPDRLNGFAEYIRNHVISKGVFYVASLNSWNNPDRIFTIEYIETNEQLETHVVTDPQLRPIENPVNADLQIYSSSFVYDPTHGGGIGGIAVEPMCDQNHQESHEQGFSRTPNEFRNVEITSYFQVDEVSDPAGYLFLEARSNNNHPGWDAQCCSDHGYGVRIYTGTSSKYKGKLAFYKRTFSGGQKVLPIISQTPNTIIDTFYQRAFGAKFVIYNTDSETNERVRIELWLTNVNWEYPEAEASNAWTKVAEVEDYVGRGWSSFGKECGAEYDDQPITWAAPFVSIGWREVRHVRMMYTSFREIDINGSFGQDPIPDPEPDPDPTTPDPPVEPEPTEDPAPPDAEIPTTPTSLSKRITLRREIINSSTCVCNGVPNPNIPDPPDDGGSGGGAGTLRELYFVSLSTKGYAKLAQVANSTSHYLRFGQAVTQTWSPWIGKPIVRVEMTIAEEDTPKGNIYCRIRKASDDSIAATLNPPATGDNIKDKGIVCIFENLNNNYKIQFEDKLLFELESTDTDKDNYIKIFRRSGQKNTGTKIVWQSNADDAGEYHYDASYDICARIYYIEGQTSGVGETDYDVTVIKKHRYQIIGAISD